MRSDQTTVQQNTSQFNSLSSLLPGKFGQGHPYRPISLFALVIAFLIPVSLSGCHVIPSAEAAQVNTPAPILYLTQVINNQPATATPFQPIAPTPTITPSPTPIKPTPTPAPTMQVFNEDNLPPLEDGLGRVIFVLLGSDQRSDPSFRTDVIILVSINTEDATISLVSFPRDLYVTIPGYIPNRINVAQSYGGFNLLQSVFQTNFGVVPKYYMLTDFSSFQRAVKVLGDLDVEVAKPINDKCDLPWSEGGYCRLDPGTVRMDGKTALWYVRSRGGTSDFDRTRRAQEVLVAMGKRVLSLNAMTHAGELYEILVENVETNIPRSLIFDLLPVAVHVAIDPDRIHHYTISTTMVSNYVDPYGQWVLWPDLAQIQAMVREAISQ